MKKTKNLAELAESWGIDFQVFRIKEGLIDTIKAHCQKQSISQRKLASLVPGLSQDRVSKIFTGQVGHMTIDKLVEIHSALGLRVQIQSRVA